MLAIGGYDNTQITTWIYDESSPTIDTADSIPAVKAGGSIDLPRASFVAWHPNLPVLYAVSEVDDGKVAAYTVDKTGQLSFLAEASTGGSGPCWVACLPTADALVVANYQSGSLAMLELRSDGSISGMPVVVAHHGSGPVPGRQDAPHVHQVVPTPAGTLLATDLGTDTLVEYRPGDGVLVELARTAMPAGSGPRHMAIAASGTTGFVVGELDGTITVIERTTQPDTATERWVATGQVPSSTHSTDAESPRDPSQVQLVNDDRFLLVANRGPSTLALLDVGDNLRIIAEEPTGQWPRHFTVAGDTVFVAAKKGGHIALHRIDPTSGTIRSLGRLKTTKYDVSLPAPTAVAIAPSGIWA